MMRKTLAYLDDEDTQKNLATLLRQDFKLIALPSADAAIALAETTALAGIILSDYTSTKLPKEIKCLRKTFERATILIASDTCREENAQMALLQAGADYVMRSVKPEGDKAALLLIETKLHRGIHRHSLYEPPKTIDHVLQIDGFHFDKERHEASYKGTPFILTATEFNILLMLAKSPDTVFDRSTLITSAYAFQKKEDSMGEDERSCDTHMKRLRLKLAKLGIPDCIGTVYGIGYQFKRRDPSLAVTNPSPSHRVA